MCTHMYSREPSVVAKDFFTSLPTNHSNGFCWNAGSAFGVQSGHRRRTPRRSSNASWAAFFRLSLFLGFSLHFMSVSPFLGLVDSWPFLFSSPIACQWSSPPPVVARCDPGGRVFSIHINTRDVSQCQANTSPVARRHTVGYERGMAPPKKTVTPENPRRRRGRPPGKRFAARVNA